MNERLNGTFLSTSHTTICGNDGFDDDDLDDNDFDDNDFDDNDFDDDEFDDDDFDYDEDPAVDLLVMFTFALLDIPAGSKGVWDNWSHLAEGIRRC